MKQRTLSIIKPDALKKKVVGKIIDRFESNGLEVIAMKRLHLSVKDTENFYAIHRERPFFKDLIEFMVSGPVVVMVLEAKMPWLKTEILWERLIPNSLKKALSERILLKALTLMRCMGAIAWKMRAMKSLSFLPLEIFKI